MALSTDLSTEGAGQLLDENEQLRAALESALEENAILSEDVNRLRFRMDQLSSELHASRRLVVEPEDRRDRPATPSEAEEALRVAFEELQVLTEELEIANTSLHETNQELDARVAQRTEQLKEINQVLSATEASLRAVADLVPDLLWRADAMGRADWFNQRWVNYTGETAKTSVALGWLKAIHPLDRDATRATWTAAVTTGKPFQHEFRLRDADGNHRWFLARAEPLRDDGGRILHWFAAGTDIHGQRSAMEALQQSELRFRTLIEGVPQLVWRAVGGGRWTWSSPQWSHYTGQDEIQARGLGWVDAFHPDDRQAALEAWTRAREGGALEIEGRIFHAPEDRYRHFRTRALPVRDGLGRVAEWLGTSTDVDDIVQLQEAQGVLVTELQHRTRNLMAVVQAVTARTLRGASSLEKFAECIDDRFSALARVQGLLARRDTGVRVPFDLLLREELSAHVELGDEARVRLEGPAGVPLRSATVQTFALALHELATNAVKYGALSGGDGRLDVTWGVRSDEARGLLLWVDWRESGVSGMPTGQAPARGGGYGRELIERALPYQLGARTTYGFESDGVHCTIEVAVPAEPMSLEKSDG